MTAIKTTRTIRATNCGHCGILFGLESAFMNARQDDGQSFYCPNGHRIGWEAANEAARVARDLRYAVAREVALQDQLGAAIRDAEAARVEQLRLLSRIARGVCPCCNRSFTNVRAHVATKHPEVLVPSRKQPKNPYRCSCGRAFGSFAGLRRHQTAQRSTTGDYAWDKPKQVKAWAHLTVAGS